jgi:hypothetical protein
VDPINAATLSINIRMFSFTDATLLHVVIAAHHQGAKKFV